MCVCVYYVGLYFYMIGCIYMFVRRSLSSPAAAGNLADLSDGLRVGFIHTE